MRRGKNNVEDLATAPFLPLSPKSAESVRSLLSSLTEDTLHVALLPSSSQTVREGRNAERETDMEWEGRERGTYRKEHRGVRE